MIDFTKEIEYRSVELNDALQANPGRLRGNMVRGVRWLPVQGVGYTEKRSQADGRDASDVFLDGRRLIVRGTTYGDSGADLSDRLQQIKSTFLPTAAFNDNPGSYGYVPFYFKSRTEDLANFPSGVKDLYINVRPAAGIAYDEDRDRNVPNSRSAEAFSGIGERGGGINWEVALDAKDPRIYVDPTTFIDFATNDTADSGNLLNRGDYPAPLNVMLVVQTQAKPGFWTLTGAGTVLQLAIPQSPNTQTIRYNGTLKVATIETLGIEVLRMDIIDFPVEEQHPVVAPGITPFSWTSVWSGGGSTYMTIPMANGSRMFYAESFA